MAQIRVQVSYRDARPIYEQVRDSLRSQILAGVIGPGERLPSVRELSSALAVNPNTVQRAYRELEQEGCVYSVRGRGSYVAEVGDVARARREELLGRLDALVAELRDVGCTTGQLVERIMGGEGHDGNGDGDAGAEQELR